MSQQLFDAIKAGNVDEVKRLAKETPAQFVAFDAPASQRFDVEA